MNATYNSAASTKLGNIEQLILLTLFRHAEEGGQDCTASMIRSELKQGRNPTDVLFGSLYAALARLEEKGLIISKALPPEPVQGGRKKSAFEPTVYGKTVAKAIIDDLKNQAMAFDKI